MTEKRKPTRRDVLANGLGVAALSALPLPAIARGSPATKPNILFILADDLGYADLSVYGRDDYETPVLDRLARDGMLFTQGYANSPICSPTRVALFTGRYQYRYRAGLDEPIAMDASVGLPPEEPNLASMFRALGYHTSLIGKWHLGALPDFGPLKSGYDHFFGIRGGVADYFHYDLAGPYRGLGGLYDGAERVERHGYLTDLLADAAIREIQHNADSGLPFLMSLHFTAPHWPWQGPDDQAISETLTNSLHWNGGSIETYGEMVKSMDANIGRVLEKLQENGLDQNTIVVFTSDNGGERFSLNWPFTGVKTELLEGGIRVPLIIRWPDMVTPGSVCEQVMISMDFLPTLLAAAGVSPAGLTRYDGDNLLPVLLGEKAPYARKLFWRYKAGAQAAVRDGDWKYLRLHDREFLFNLANDVRERARLNDDFPDVLAELKADFDAWDKTMLAYPDNSYSHDLRNDLADR